MEEWMDCFVVIFDGWVNGGIKTHNLTPLYQPHLILIQIYAFIHMRSRQRMRFIGPRAARPPPLIAPVVAPPAVGVGTAGYARIYDPNSQHTHMTRTFSLSHIHPNPNHSTHDAQTHTTLPPYVKTRQVKFHYVITHQAAWITSGAVERAKAGDDAMELRCVSKSVRTGFSSIVLLTLLMV